MSFLCRAQTTMSCYVMNFESLLLKEFPSDDMTKPLNASIGVANFSVNFPLQRKGPQLTATLQPAKGWAFLLSPTSHHLSPQLLHLKCLSLILEARSQAVTVTDGDMGEITVKLVDWHKGHLEVWVACHRRRAVKLAAPSSVSYFKIWSLTFAFSSSDMASKDSLLISGKPRTYPPHPMCSPFQVRGRTDAYA